MLIINSASCVLVTSTLDSCLRLSTSREKLEAAWPIQGLGCTIGYKLINCTASVGGGKDLVMYYRLFLPLLQMFAIGYGHVNTLQSVLVADQFTEEQVTA